MTDILSLPESTLTKQQYKSFGPRAVEGYGKDAALWAHVRFDDECGNGHNTFAITGNVRVPKQRDEAAVGCLHDDIAKVFPELAPLIKWHLCSTDGPMHYLASTLYLAGDRDCNGRKAGDVSTREYGIRFNDVPITHRVKKSFWLFLRERRMGILEGSSVDGMTVQSIPPNVRGEFQVFAIAHDREPQTYGPHYSLVGYAEKWHECPFRDKTEADEFCAAMNQCRVEFTEVPTAWSQGKARELDKARHAAIWHDATDEELCLPDLKERLVLRLPVLMQDFKQAVESLGFTY
jgi:hypothetical protein